MHRETSVDNIVAVVRGADAQRNVEELIQAREDDPNLLSRFDHAPQVLSSMIREYVDDEGTVFLLDTEDHEISFLAYGFLCEIMLPLNLSDLAKSKDRFKPGTIRQQVSVIGGGSPSFAKFLSAQRAIYTFMANTTGREPFRSFVQDNFAGMESLTSATKLFTKQVSGVEHQALDLPESLDYTGRVQDVCRRKGFVFTEDNMVKYWKLVPAITKAGFDVMDVPVSYFTVGQLIEMRLSFRAHKIGHSYMFRSKLNSIVVYNDDVSRIIDEISYNEDRARRESTQIRIGAPKMRKLTGYRLPQIDNIRFLKDSFHAGRSKSVSEGTSGYGNEDGQSGLEIIIE